MKVTKRNGSQEPVNIEKIINSVKKVCEGLENVDHFTIATKTVGGLYDGVSTKELDELSIQTAVGFVKDDPIYSKVASRLLNSLINKEVTGQEIHSFSQSIQLGYDNGLISQSTLDFVNKNKRKLNSAIKEENTNLFEYYGLKVVYDRYLLKHPTKRFVFETPQYWLLRVACGLSDDVKDVIEFYELLSSLDYMTSTPTLFNSGTTHSQMSSCYLLASPIDDLLDIEKKHKDIAMLSKWAGGIGLSYSNVRGTGSLIKGTNGKSNGIIPFLHSLDANIAAVNQCLLPDSKVETSGGLVEIEELIKGNLVNTTSGLQEIAEVMEGEYEGEVFEIISNGKSITLTPEHPLLIIKNAANHPIEEVERLFNEGLLKAEWLDAKDIRETDILLTTEY
jgi:ribonucleoside-diphosphate reductase alpha chain